MQLPDILFPFSTYILLIQVLCHRIDTGDRQSSCRGPNASNPARGRTLLGQERPSNGRPDASQRRPGSMLCPVGLPGALSVCSGSAGASVVAHSVALPLYRDCFLDLRLFNSPDLRRLVLCYCCQAWTLETVLGGNTALTRWWTARSIDADAKR